MSHHTIDYHCALCNVYMFSSQNTLPDQYCTTCQVILAESDEAGKQAEYITRKTVELIMGNVYKVIDAYVKGLVKHMDKESVTEKAQTAAAVGTLEGLKESLQELEKESLKHATWARTQSLRDLQEKK